MSLFFLHCLSYADKINTLMVIFTFIAACFSGLIFIVGYSQLKDFRKSKQVEFTYKVDEDFSNFLNNPANKKAKDWLIDGTEINEEDYDILRQLFDEFEAVYSLMKQRVVNDEIFYDLLSYYVESIFNLNNKPLADVYIKQQREIAEKDGVTRPNEIYIGIERLYAKVKKMATQRPPEPDFI